MKATKKTVNTKRSSARRSPTGDIKKDGNKNTWNLRLYIAGQTPKSITALANLHRICEQELAGRYQVEVIDLMKQPELARNDQIIAIPTLVRKLPEPMKRLIGDLSSTERVLFNLELSKVQGM